MDNEMIKDIVFSIAKAQATTSQEAYKRGYIDGRIDGLEEAKKPVEKEVINNE